MVPIPVSRPLKGRIDPLAPAGTPVTELLVCGVQHPYCRNKPRGSINASSVECYSLLIFLTYSLRCTASPLHRIVFTVISPEANATACKWF